MPQTKKERIFVALLVFTVISTIVLGIYLFGFLRPNLPRKVFQQAPIPVEYLDCDLHVVGSDQYSVRLRSQGSCEGANSLFVVYPEPVQGREMNRFARESYKLDDLVIDTEAGTVTHIYILWEGDLIFWLVVFIVVNFIGWFCISCLYAVYAPD